MISSENSQKIINVDPLPLYYQQQEDLLVCYQDLWFSPKEISLGREFFPNTWSFKQEKIAFSRLKSRFNTAILLLGNDFIFDRDSTAVLNSCSELQNKIVSHGLKFYCCVPDKSKNMFQGNYSFDFLSSTDLLNHSECTLFIGGNSTLTFELLEKGKKVSLFDLYFKSFNGLREYCTNFNAAELSLLSVEVVRQKVSCDTLVTKMLQSKKRTKVKIGSSWKTILGELLNIVRGYEERRNIK